MNSRLAASLGIPQPCCKYSVPNARSDVLGIGLNFHRLRFIRLFWQAVSEESGARVIVDSSKSPTLLACRLLYAPHPVFTIHLVRDPRSVVASFVREKRGAVSQHARYWVRTQHTLELMSLFLRDKYLRVRYEDLCRDPEDTLRKICDFVGMRFSDDWQSWYAQPYHGVSGNWQTVAKKNSGEIKEQIRWPELLTTQEIQTIEQIVGWRLEAYGYGRELKLEKQFSSSRNSNR